MPRPPRIIHAGQPLHIMQRGNNRCSTFADAADFSFYLQLLVTAARTARCQIHAYVLMTNHIHLLVTPAKPAGPPLLMKAVSEKYARYYNARQQRTGTLWEGRYRSTPIDSTNYFFACSRYIEMNPVRAGIAKYPGEYPWSSFPENAGEVRKMRVIPHAVYDELARGDAGRREAYRAMFDKLLDEDTMNSIRYMIGRRSINAGASPHAVRAETARRVLGGALDLSGNAPAGAVLRPDRMRFAES